MGIFPEDNVIRVSRLIKLWVAEGFIRSNKTQTLEEVAQGYLRDLIDRNLLVLRTESIGKLKTCQMHDLLRDLCLKIAEKENFLCVIRAGNIQRAVLDKGRRIVFQKGNFDALESASSLTRSLVSNGDLKSVNFKLLKRLKLLRVLNVPHSLYHRDAILKKVNLRHVCIDREFTFGQSRGDIFSSTSLLWNLQTLIIGEFAEGYVAPPEIWEMRELRHVNVSLISLPDPPSSNEQSTNDVGLRNLQSLKIVWDLRLSDEVYKRIPNVKKLIMVYRDLLGNSYCFGRLHKLEFLKCVFWERALPNDLLQILTFPSSLQKLVLSGCRLRWEDLSMIGSLPRLQVLELETGSVIGPEWNPVEGEFPCLKVLKIYGDDLVNWNADNYSFPVLEKLVLVYLKNLNEIPSGIGEIPTLGLIELAYCSEYLAISAVQTLEEQESLGNEGLQVRIDFLTHKQKRSFMEKVQHMECFTSTNLRLT